MTPFNRTLASLVLALGLGAPLSAQEAPAMLVADAVFLEGDTRLVAEGRVEALAGDTRIIAQKITYDRATETLAIDGPIRIEQDGGVRVLASSAEMDAGFQNAILKGARLVLDQQVQLAAYQMNRVNGRYSQLYKASVTSCMSAPPSSHRSGRFARAASFMTKPKSSSTLKAPSCVCATYRCFICPTCACPIQHSSALRAS